ncbi:hypothetical protein BC835DRAFT_1369299 [Cytidiella melzeri]|nr:hypothetical protein BC835DRAFT_1369299 [Cytidiella melzeri]
MQLSTSLVLFAVVVVTSTFHTATVSAMPHGTPQSRYPSPKVNSHHTGELTGPNRVPTVARPPNKQPPGWLTRKPDTEFLKSLTNASPNHKGPKFLLKEPLEGESARIMAEWTKPPSVAPASGRKNSLLSALNFLSGPKQQG